MRPANGMLLLHHNFMYDLLIFGKGQKQVVSDIPEELGLFLIGNTYYEMQGLQHAPRVLQNHLII